MRFFSRVLPCLALLSPLIHAEKVIESSSVGSCQDNSGFTPTLFDVSYTPNNNSLFVNLDGVSSISGNVTAQLQIIAYGFTFYNYSLNPCELGLSGFCPLTSGQNIQLLTYVDVPGSVLKDIPGVVWYVPDFDGVVKLQVWNINTGEQVACMEADLTNTKSVYQPAVAWAVAIIAGLGLIASGIASGLGNVNTAAHIAAYAIALFGFFQAQAFIGMSSVAMPPIVQSWTQNFQWSMGIIRVGFLQSIATWYQRSTGGTPTTYLETLSVYTVNVQKRAIKRAVPELAALASGSIRAYKHVLRRAASSTFSQFLKRATTSGTTGSSSTSTTNKSVTVRGIDRVGYRAGIEQTNIFMTGLIFFIFILFVVTVLVALCKLIFEAAVRARWMKQERFQEFRAGWKIVTKGILFRLILLGFVQMSVLCLWELVERDSAAEVILAIIVFLSMAGALAWAAFKVISLAKKSLTMHQNPGYILYSDPKCLNKWGFLYVQYRASAYYFVVAFLAYIVIKAAVLAFTQSSPIAQAICLLIIEGVALIGVSILRPWMDRMTNIINILIAAMNFFNTIFLLIFSNVFGQTQKVNGIMGVLFALINLIFVFFLLFLLIFASLYSIFAKNPEIRYQPMRDDRSSFIKSQQALTTELDALGATARGDQHDIKRPYSMAEDAESNSTDSLAKEHRPASAQPYMQETTQYYPSENTGRRGPGYAPQQMYNQPNASDYSYGHSTTASPAPYNRVPVSNGYGPQQTYPSRNQNTSPWQRGAGYD